MGLRRVLLVAACLLLCCRAAPRYDEEEEDYGEVAYDDSYYNEIPVDGGAREGPTEAPCQARETSRWDKLFIMMEDSQMRQNMLLHSLDTVVVAELRTLGAELRRSVARGDGATAAAAAACTRAAEAVAGRLGRRVERAVEEEEEQAGAEGAAPQDGALQLPPETGRTEEGASSLERAGPGTQEVTSGVIGGAEVARLEQAVAAMATDLQRIRAQLDVAQRTASQNFLPAGCDRALLFPKQSRIRVSVPLSTWSAASATICLWVKPGEALNGTILVNYATQTSPQRLQLRLTGGGGVLFTVGRNYGQPGPETEAPGVAPDGRWSHLCATWSREEGRASLWADGRLVAGATGEQGTYAMPADGLLGLGQLARFERDPDEKLAFVGKMTGVNVWNRVLEAEEIAQLARPDGACGQGSVFSWSLSSVDIRSGAEYIT